MAFSLPKTILVLILIIIPSVNNLEVVDSTISSKAFFLTGGLLVLLGCVMSTLLLTKTEEVKFKISKIDISLFFLLVYIIINRYILQSFHGFSIRFIELLLLSFLYLGLRILSLKDYPIVLLSIMLSGIVQGLFFLQVFDNFSPTYFGITLGGGFFNPGPLAGFCATLIVISLGFYVFRFNITSKKTSYSSWTQRLQKICFDTLRQYIPLICMGVIFFILPRTGSRAAWLASLVGCTSVLIYRYRALNKIKALSIYKKVFMCIIVLLVLAVGIFKMYHFKKNSADGRILIWKVTGKMIVKNPIFGIGYDSFKAHYMEEQAYYFERVRKTGELMVADNNSYAFNEILQFLSENGIVGFFHLIVVVFLGLKLKVKEENGFIKVLILIVLGTIVIFSLFSYPSQILPIKIIIVVMFSLLATIDNRKYCRTYHTGRSSFFGKGTKALKLSLVFLGIVVIWEGSSKFRDLKGKYRSWKIAKDLYKYGLYKKSVAEFEKAIPGLENCGELLLNYGKALVMAGQDDKALPILENAKIYLNNTILETTIGDVNKTMGNYEQAEIAYQKAANMVPSRFYPDYLLVKLYDETGQKKKAVERAKIILDKRVKIPSRAIKEIKEEMKKIVDK
ncbi:O-antigen ligase family protein [Maribacter algicola]|uniref:O-antigen ligase family protein n=1 Tax=Meishania litoralis TaxID=3434685 RepID=A0ACC7LFC8_9FLAO